MDLTSPTEKGTYKDGEAHGISQPDIAADLNQDEVDLQTASRLSTGSIDIDESGNIISSKPNVDARRSDTTKPEIFDPTKLTDDELHV